MGCGVSEIPKTGAAAPASEVAPRVTVSINGVSVPRDKAVVFLHLGHSNMAGRAFDPASLRPYFYQRHPHLWRYQQGGVWTPAIEPLSGDGGTAGNPNGAGPGMAILRTALAAAPDSYFISIGRGAGLDYGSSCFAFRKGGVFHDQIIAPAKELVGQVTFGGLFVMLSFDARTDPRSRDPGFLDCLAGLAADFRDELDAPDLPFIQSDFERGAVGTWAPTCCGAPQVIAQLARVPGTIARSVLVPTDGIPMQDNHHFNLAGHQIWVQRAFSGLAQQGLMPWAVAAGIQNRP
jgi:hypothetical protein